MLRTEVVMTDHPPRQFSDDLESFETFVTTRSVALQRFAYLITGHPEDARDTVQDALAGLLPRWSQVLASGDPEAYVRRSIVNAHISRWRATKREQTWDPAWLETPSPDAAAHVPDAMTAIQWCAALPPKQRAAVVLRFFDDYSYAQIAAVCGMTPGAARVLVHRALTSLRARLKEDSND